MQSCYEKMWEYENCFSVKDKLKNKTKYEEIQLNRERLHTIYSNLLCMNQNPKYFNISVQSIIFIFSVIEETPSF